MMLNYKAMFNYKAALKYAAWMLLQKFHLRKKLVQLCSAKHMQQEIKCYRLLYNTYNDKSFICKE